MSIQPADWEGDWVAILRASHGDPVPLDPWERREAIYWLTRQGLSGREIAGRLGMSRRQVCRHRTKLREGGLDGPAVGSSRHRDA